MPSAFSHVYVLFDPREPDVPRYVGCTQFPEHRLKQHCTPSTRLKIVYAWIAQLAVAGVVPGIRTVATYSDRWDAMRAERRLIRQLTRDAAPLLNRSGTRL